MENCHFNESGACVRIRHDHEHGRIEMWSTHRLPYEPKGALAAARNELRRRLPFMVPIGDRFLEARYVSPIRTFVDTENVLVYNVGPSAFRSAARYGIEFKREYSPVPLDASEKTPWMHYHRY
jgi:hypothetical protein